MARRTGLLRKKTVFLNHNQKSVFLKKSAGCVRPTFGGLFFWVRTVKTDDTDKHHTRAHHHARPTHRTNPASNPSSRHLRAHFPWMRHQFHGSLFRAVHVNRTLLQALFQQWPTLASSLSTCPMRRTTSPPPPWSAAATPELVARPPLLRIFA